jgi:hypothetical protein
MTVKRIVSTVVVSLSLALVAPAASGESGIGSLVHQLARSSDFRLRVQAALQLGKSKDTRATRPLVKALDDKDVSVRAAAAAALKTLGDPEALPALRDNRLDRSPIVRRQVKESIIALETRMKAVRVLVQVGSMKNRTPRAERGVAVVLDQASRKTLQSIEVVNVVGDADETMELARRRNLPAIMMTGSVRKLDAESSGSSVTYTAKVEYILHRMPEQAIAGKVSGSASARATAAEMKDQRRRDKLREQVLFAAVESALRRVQPALLQVAAL